MSALQQWNNLHRYLKENGYSEPEHIPGVGWYAYPLNGVMKVKINPKYYLSDAIVVDDPIYSGLIEEKC